MKKSSVLLAILILLTWKPVFSQSLFTFQDAASGARLRPQGREFVQWIPGTPTFTYVEKFQEMKADDVAKAHIRTLVSLTDINMVHKAASIEEMPYFPYAYEWVNATEFVYEASGHVVVYDYVAKRITRSYTLREGAENVEINDKARIVAYTVENNIWYTKAGGTPVAITKDSDKGIVNGSSYVHRQEFGIDKGIFISPHGKYIAFYRKDEMMVTDYPLVNTQTRIAEEVPVKYPMAGMTSENVTLGIYDPATARVHFVKTEGPKDQYLTAISWTPDENAVYIGVLNRGQNHLKMNRYNATSGNFETTIFEEKHDTWVEPENPLYFLPDGRFIWQTEKDGYNHLYLYDKSGAFLKQLTRGEWMVTQILGTDASGKNVYVQGTHNNGLERRIFKVDVAKGTQQVLGDEKGIHNAVVSKDGAYLLENYSSAEVPNIVRVTSGNGKILREVLTAANPLTDYTMPRIQLVTITAADGKTPLNLRIITPPNPTATEKYPVILYVYGGPHLQLVQDRWLCGASFWDLMMAQKGYVVVSVDNRGSASRGFAFENVVHRQLGQEEMKDQLKAIEYLKKQSYTDASRVGVYGWSYGGFMTTSLMTAYPEIFKVGVAGGPVMDWKYYEIMYGERYMDTPEENPKGYELTSLLNKAGKLEGQLLIIHGAMDNVVVWQHSLDFLRSCIKANKQVDYFVYPDTEHNVIPKDRPHLMEKITRYFDLHLKKR